MWDVMVYSYTFEGWWRFVLHDAWDHGVLIGVTRLAIGAIAAAAALALTSRG
jgi:hypothetical protein